MHFAICTNLLLINTNVYLYDNALTGTLPSEWSAWTQLQVLEMFDNYISGTLPATWSAWTQLTLLYLQSNTVPSTRRGLTGTLPEQWQSLRALQFLNLAHNCDAALDYRLSHNDHSAEYFQLIISRIILSHFWESQAAIN